MSISIEKAETILANWKINGTITPVERGGYSGSDIFIVEAEGEKYILRRDGVMISRAHGPLLHLENKGFNIVPTPILIPDTNKSFIKEGEDYWELTKLAKGKTLTSRPNTLQAYSLGQTIAQFHLALSDYPADSNIKIDKPIREIIYDDKFEWWENLSELNTKMLRDWGVFELSTSFVNRCQEVHENILDKIDWKLLEDTVPKNIIHRDLWGEHIFFDGNNVSGIIDFGTMRYGRRVEDLIRIVTEFGDRDLVLIREIIKGYESAIPLSAEEKEYFIPIMLVGPIRGIFWGLRKAIEDKDDFSRYPITLKQMIKRGTDSLEWMSKTKKEDLFC